MSVFFQPPIAISGGGGSSSIEESKSPISIIEGSNPVFTNDSLTLVETVQSSFAAAQIYSAELTVTTAGSSYKLKLGQMQSSQIFPLQNTSPSVAYFVSPSSTLVEVRFYVNVDGEFIVETVGAGMHVFGVTGVWRVPLMCATWIATT